MDVICDIDGTLAEISHRRHYVTSRPKDWKSFNEAMHLDEPNVTVIEAVRAMWFSGRARILLASGRGEEHRGVTEEWLRKQYIFTDDCDRDTGPAFIYEKLYMRPERDNRPDVVVKREILDQMRVDGFNPVLAIDDRDGVVSMWRESGLTCFQVDFGNF